MSTKHTAAHEKHVGSTATYVTGFILSIVLTLIPYSIVVNEWLTGYLLGGVLVAFALAQLLVQLIFFLHIGHESKPRWNLLAFLFMALVVLIVVIGTLWIMRNLDYNMMHGRENELLDLQEQRGF